MHIEGGIAVGEAARHAGRAAARINGHPMPMLIANGAILASMAILMIVYSGLADVLDWPHWLFFPALIASAIIGTFAGQRAGRAWATRVGRRALASRGLQTPVPVCFAISPEGITTRTGRAETRAPWSAVSDLLNAGPYWVAIIESCPAYLPRRFFATEAAERAFISEMLARMAPEARARSADAVRFLAT